MKNYFKVQLNIMNLPEEEDYVKEDIFKKEYLEHSYLLAKEKFEKGLKLIASGKLLENINEHGYEEVILKTGLVLVKVEEGVEEEYLTRTSDEPEMAIHIEEAALDRDYMTMLRELKKGHVRHPLSIEDTWYYQVETKEKKPGKTEEIEIEKLKLSVYGDFEVAFREMSHIFYWEESRIAGYDPEYGESYIINKFLVQKNGDKEVKILLADNFQEYPLNAALKREIEDKFHMEKRAAGNREDGPLFGKSEVIYEIELAYRKKQRDLKYPKVTFAVLVTFGDMTNPEFSEMDSHIFEEEGGEDLFIKEAEAYKFYEDRHYDHIQGYLSSEIASALGPSDYFIQTVQFTYLVDNEEHFHTLYQENTLDLDLQHAPRLKEIKENRRDDLTRLNPHTEEDYIKLSDSLEILREINKRYIVFIGKNWIQPEKERIFYHHNLLTARKAALHFYKQAKEEEYAADSPKPVSLIIYAFDLRDNPYYIASTNVEYQEYLEFGRQEERKFYTELGYRLSVLEEMV